MTKTKTYFVSDVHLGAGYIADRVEHERLLVKWLKSIQDDCRKLFLVGDILDYWYEYKTVVPRGYVRFFGQLAEMSDNGVEICWLIGNHDIWISDYIPKELGVRVVDGNVQEEIGGKTFFISHGDGLGNIPGGFRFMRSLFRNKVCQKLFSAVHPGLTVPLAHRWSCSSRKSQQFPSYEGYLDIIRQWANEFRVANPEVNYIILGHYHVLLDESLGENCRLVILGDWINKFSYAVFDGEELIIGKYC